MTLLEALLFFGGGTPAGPGAPPSGAPSALSSSTYSGGTLVRLHWTNGDASAYTRIYKRAGGCGFSAALYATANPGATSFDTGHPVGGTGPAVITGWEVRHYKNGQESAASNCIETVEGDQF